MMTEKGSLPVGVEHGGKVHRDFELRPEKLRDSMEAMAENPEKAKDRAYLTVAVLAKQTVRLGDIPREKITPEMILDMYADDAVAITDAGRRLREKMRSFRSGGAAAPHAGASTAAHGV